MKIHGKLIALGASAVTGVLLPSLWLFRSSYVELRALSQFRNTTEISLQAYELADNVTRERQLAYQAAGFSGEGTREAQLARYAAAIAASRQSMSQLQERLGHAQQQYAPRFRENLQNALLTEKAIDPIRAELLVAERETARETVTNLRTKALKAYDVVLFTQANFLPVLCLETQDAELVRRIVTQDNVARLQRDFWKVKGLVNTVLRDNKLSEVAFGELKTKRLSMDDHLSRLRNLADPDTAQAIETLLAHPDYTLIVRLADQALAKGVKATDFSELGDQSTYQSGPFTRVEQAFSQLAAAVSASIVNYTDGHLAQARWRLVGMATGGLATVLVLSLLAALIGRGIARPLQSVSRKLVQAADQGAESARVIADSSKVLSDDASEGASALEEISASVEELTSMTQSNLGHIHQLTALAERANQTTDEGSRQMRELVEAMVGLQRTNQDIAKILKTIDEIAFQTNILALNAAVEAARAGEAGAGFAIVADEVRNLAQRSAAAARETRERIEASQGNNTRSAELSQLVDERFRTISSVTRDYHQLVAQIDQASTQSTQGLNQVREALHRLDQTTQRTAATAEENASASAEFAHLVAELRHSIAALEAMVKTAERATTPDAAAGR